MPENSVPPDLPKWSTSRLLKDYAVEIAGLAGIAVLIGVVFEAMALSSALRFWFCMGCAGVLVLLQVTGILIKREKIQRREEMERSTDFLKKQVEAREEERRQIQEGVRQETDAKLKVQLEALKEIGTKGQSTAEMVHVVAQVLTEDMKNLGRVIDMVDELRSSVSRLGGLVIQHDPHNPLLPKGWQDLLKWSRPPKETGEKK